MKSRSDSQMLLDLKHGYWSYNIPKQVFTRTCTQFWCRNFCKNSNFSGFQANLGSQTKTFQKWGLNLRNGSPKRFAKSLGSRTSVLIISYPKKVCAHTHTHIKIKTRIFGFFGYFHCRLWQVEFCAYTFVPLGGPTCASSVPPSCSEPFWTICKYQNNLDC